MNHCPKSEDCHIWSASDCQHITCVRWGDVGLFTLCLFGYTIHNMYTQDWRISVLDDGCISSFNLMGASMLVLDENLLDFFTFVQLSNLTRPSLASKFGASIIDGLRDQESPSQMPVAPSLTSMTSKRVAAAPAQSQTITWVRYSSRNQIEHKPSCRHNHSSAVIAGLIGVIVAIL